MGRPRALDLFCGAGGAAVGLYRAGFDVVGVDIKPRPRYPFEFHQGDALSFAAAGFDLVWASPPCQRFSIYSRNLGTSENHPDLLDPTRGALEASGAVWIIENVPGAPLRQPTVLCGSMFDLDVRRHRLFETSFPIFPFLECRHWIWKDRKYPGVLERLPVDVTGKGNRRHVDRGGRHGVCKKPLTTDHARRAMDVGKIAPVPVYGRGTPQWHRKKYGRNISVDEQRAAMTIGWMTREELSQAIPPAYSEWLGRHALNHLARRAAVL